jgi:acetolactate decarboxylase
MNAFALRYTLSVGLCTVFAASLTFARTQQPLVSWQHSMREMFATGDISGKVALAPLTKTPHLYAIGPGENLRSELLVWDGVVQESRVSDGKAQITIISDARAVFLVYAYVPKWQSVVVPSSVKTSAQLLSWVKTAAHKAGLSSEQPFPFLLSGTVEQADYHIVDTPSDGTPFTREKHDKHKWHATLRNADVEMLGFYSEKHAGVFVHHSSPAHLHVRSKDGKVMGHLDGFVPGKRMILMLPAQGR